MCTPAVSHSARIVTPSSVRFKPELLGRFITLNGTLTVIAVHNVSLVFQDLFLFFSPFSTFVWCYHWDNGRGNGGKRSRYRESWSVGSHVLDGEFSFSEEQCLAFQQFEWRGGALGGFFFFLAAWLCFIRPFGFRTEDVKLFFELLNSAESREIFIVWLEMTAVSE